MQFQNVICVHSVYKVMEAILNIIFVNVKLFFVQINSLFKNFYYFFKSVNLPINIFIPLKKILHKAIQIFYCEMYSYPNFLNKQYIRPIFNEIK